MNDTKHTVPAGWTKGEKLAIERKGSSIVIEQANLPRAYSKEVMGKAYDVAYLHYTKSAEAIAFLEWWLS